MNWICDECGYENEYNDETQPTECLCCGGPASEAQLKSAQRALEEFHEAEARRLREEAARARALQRQEQIARLFRGFARTMKALPVLCAVSCLAALLLSGIEVYRGGIAFSAFGTNIEAISCISNVSESADAASDYLMSQLVRYRDEIIANHVSQGPLDAIQNAQDAVESIGTDNTVRFQSASKNLTVILSNISSAADSALSNAAERAESFSDTANQPASNMPTAIKNTSSIIGNLTTNIGGCRDNAASNLSNLIQKITSRFEGLK